MLLYRVLVARLIGLTPSVLAARSRSSGPAAPRGELRVVDTGPGQLHSHWQSGVLPGGGALMTKANGSDHGGGPVGIGLGDGRLRRGGGEAPRRVAGGRQQPWALA